MEPSRLRAAARDLQRVAAALDTALDGYATRLRDALRGPAADRLLAELRDHAARLTRTSAELRRQARALDARAVALESATATP